MDSLRAAASRILNHISNRDTDRGSHITRTPTELYRSPEQYEREKLNVLHRRPLVVGPSSFLEKPGSFFTETVAGVPLVVVRDEQAKVRVLLNVCRHRGAELVSEAKGCRRSLKCPFHGWTYHLDGSLAHVPAQRLCFGEEFSPEEFHLQELPALERASLIWAHLSPQSDDLQPHFIGLDADFEELGLTGHRPLREFHFKGDLNWKIALEAFLEVYHFQHAHQPYLLDLKFPNMSLTDLSGENARIIVPLREPKLEQPVLEWANVMYFIFPATFFLVYSDHFAVLRFIPEGANQTNFSYIPMIPKELIDTSIVTAKADFLEIILKQDFEILEKVQRNLDTSANTAFTMTRLEHMIAHFQEQVKELCSDTDSVL